LYLLAKQKGALGVVVRLEGNVGRLPYNKLPRAQRGSRGIAIFILGKGEWLEPRPDRFTPGKGKVIWSGDECREN
jgi:hypothetical protein